MNITKETTMKIDNHEKALIFWLGMVGIAFASIIIGMEVGEWFGNFFGLSA